MVAPVEADRLGQLCLVEVPLDAEDVVTPEKVARAVTQFSAIGHACRALEGRGWAATIAANRITVNGSVVAQFIPAGRGPTGDVEPRWMVFMVDGTPPVFVVGAGSSRERSGGSCERSCERWRKL